jgi:hypothetical protein
MVKATCQRKFFPAIYRGQRAAGDVVESTSDVWKFEDKQRGTGG